MQKYGKTYSNILALKADFISHNDVFLKNNQRIAEIYTKQPKRTKCKICGELMPENKSFHSHGINYYICGNCGHVNGEYMETECFTSGLYEKSDYGRNYRVDEKNNYKERMKSIYTPKVEFLRDSLVEDDADYRTLSVLDIGAGSGYFVGAMLREGIKASGIEVSESQVSYGNKMLNGNFLTFVAQEFTVDYIRNSHAEVISFIGVLEHIVNLKEVLEAVNTNPNIKYIFFSVPMFSYSVILEALTPDVFNRLLGGAHTHIFSEQSIKYLCKENSYDVIGEWRFGTDIGDLLRTVCVKLENDDNKLLADIFKDKFINIVDNIQLELDKNMFCSEIHIVAKKRS